MNKNKGVVLEKNNQKITVLTGDGEFKTLKYKRDVEIGEEIQLPAQYKAPIWRIGASIAAVFILTFMSIFGWSVFQPRTAVAMISLDINPSLQLTLDQKGEVLELESFNSEAEQLMLGLSLEGKVWEEALDEIIQKSAELHYLTEEQNWVVVGYAAEETKKMLPTATIKMEAITQKVQEAVQEQGLKPTVAAYELTSAQKRQAQETGLSLGEYALVDTAQKAGIKVDSQAVKEKDQRESLLENPEIQEQLRKDKHIIESNDSFTEHSMRSKTNSKDAQKDGSKEERDQEKYNDNNNNNKNFNFNNYNKYNNSKDMTKGWGRDDDSKDDGRNNSRSPGNRGSLPERDTTKDSKENDNPEKSNNNKVNSDTRDNRSGNDNSSGKADERSKHDENSQNHGDESQSSERDSREGRSSHQNKDTWNFLTILDYTYQRNR
ncbi:anti-sigma factor domain-containing protein [Desulfitobacterium sp. THU1]|uniref:anti-sigma-I factor RsgI family protein n=1 Tax=Desulfitobacterium sp. THU1 TaxID=3138072 RepID=UPI00311ECD61